MLLNEGVGFLVNDVRKETVDGREVTRIDLMSTNQSKKSFIQISRVSAEVDDRVKGFLFNDSYMYRCFSNNDIDVVKIENRNNNFLRRLQKDEYVIAV